MSKAHTMVTKAWAKAPGQEKERDLSPPQLNPSSILAKIAVIVSPPLVHPDFQPSHCHQTTQSLVECCQKFQRFPTTLGMESKVPARYARLSRICLLPDHQSMAHQATMTIMNRLGPLLLSAHITLSVCDLCALCSA